MKKKQFQPVVPHVTRRFIVRVHDGEFVAHCVDYWSVGFGARAILAINDLTGCLESLLESGEHPIPNPAGHGLEAEYRKLADGGFTDNQSTVAWGVLVRKGALPHANSDERTSRHEWVATSSSARHPVASKFIHRTGVLELPSPIGRIKLDDENDHNPLIPQVCSECRGFGKVPDGSDSHYYNMISCPRCSGKGVTETRKPLFESTHSALKALIVGGHFIDCPACGVTFSLEDRSQWSGLRHLGCGCKIVPCWVL
ncbi:MAG: hypothetical protein K8I27_05010 [Planctomycetes bacterium]|nr:hypothetical protein [Planctomycetota bacterium]